MSFPGWLKKAEQFQEVAVVELLTDLLKQMMDRANEVGNQHQSAVGEGVRAVSLGRKPLQCKA